MTGLRSGCLRVLWPEGLCRTEPCPVGLPWCTLAGTDPLLGNASADAGGPACVPGAISWLSGKIGASACSPCWHRQKVSGINLERTQTAGFLNAHHYQWCIDSML